MPKRYPPEFRRKVLDLVVSGRRVAQVGAIREVSLDELAGTDTVRAVLDCTNGWYAEQTWAGTRLDRLLPASARGSVLVASVTGYRRRLPAADTSTPCCWLPT